MRGLWSPHLASLYDLYIVKHRRQPKVRQYFAMYHLLANVVVCLLVVALFPHEPRQRTVASKSDCSSIKNIHQI